MTSQQSAKRFSRTVGVFKNQQAAERAQQELRQAGFSEDRVSLTTQSIDPNPSRQESQAASSAKGGAAIGALLGVILGLLIAIGGQDFPGLTPASFSQPVPFFIVVILGAGAAGSAAGALIAGLAGANVPKSTSQPDRARLSHKYLVAVEGTETEVLEAEEILRQQGSQVQT